MFSKTAYQTTRKGRNHWRGNQGGDSGLGRRFPQPELVAGEGVSKAEGISSRKKIAAKKRWNHQRLQEPLGITSGETLGRIFQGGIR